MKKILITTFFLLFTVVFMSSALASVIITYQVLDSSVRPGGQTTVLLTFKNPSMTSISRNIKIYITPGPYLKTSTSYIELGTLDAGSSQQTSLLVNVDSSAVSTTSYLTVRAKYYPEDSMQQQEITINVPIVIRSVPSIEISNVEYSPSSIEAGNTFNLTFDLRNEGDGTAKHVKVVVVQVPNTFIVRGSPETFIENLKSKESVSISFTLTADPSLSIRTYSIPVYLSYTDETNTQNHSATKNIGLVITGSYKFIVVTESQDIITAGKRGSITIKIANAGTQDAKFVTVTPIESEFFTQIIPSVSYIGKIGSDDYDTEKFSLKASALSPGLYPLKMYLEYKDVYGNSYKEEFQTQVKIYSKEDSPKASLPVSLIFIIFLVVAVVIFFVFKKFKKKK